MSEMAVETGELTEAQELAFNSLFIRDISGIVMFFIV